jgi:hypothetical protein
MADMVHREPAWTGIYALVRQNTMNFGGKSTNPSAGGTFQPVPVSPRAGGEPACGMIRAWRNGRAPRQCGCRWAVQCRSAVRFLLPFISSASSSRRRCCLRRDGAHRRCPVPASGRSRPQPANGAAWVRPDRQWCVGRRAAGIGLAWCAAEAMIAGLPSPAAPTRRLSISSSRVISHRIPY